MTDLTKLTIAEARDALRNKDFTAVELTESYIKILQEKRQLNAFVCECPYKAVEQARASQSKIEKGLGGD